MIDTREEIINALVDAAELEHGLMAQYLYASMTLKNATDGLTVNQSTKVSRWEQRIRSVAKQEMGHLATVLNLLEAVGGGSHLDRVRFPEPNRFYHPPVLFSLEPLTLQTVERFVRFEQPVPPVFPLLGIAPEPVVFSQVGDLYNQIKQGIMLVDETELFVGQSAGQDQASWSFSITVKPVSDRASAIDAIDSIIKEGEGNSTGADGSHFGKFKTIQQEYEAELASDPAFVPHRNVISNPATLSGPGTTLIEDENTLATAQLFSACYTTLLLTLVKYYRFDDSEANQSALKGNAIFLMMRVLAPLGSLLSQLPANAHQNAGPPFEIYTLPTLPHSREASLKILQERLRIARDFAIQLSAVVTLNDVLRQVADAIDQITQSLPQ